MIDWKQKLSSRKLWAAVLAFAATVLAAVFKEEIGQETVELIGAGVAVLAVYIGGESFVDVARQIFSKVTKTEEISVTEETSAGKPALPDGDISSPGKGSIPKETADKNE